MASLKITVSIGGAASGEVIDQRYEMRKNVNNPFLCPNGYVERIREQFHKVQLSTSSYDTAWVAMVPTPGCPKYPCFPQCLDWILDNQHSDGSWGPRCSHLSLIKDDLSSTLACILALQRWKAGQEHIRRGLSFLESNFSCIMDENLSSPIGFDIIFSGMLEYAINMGLDIPADQNEISNILCRRDMELQRQQGSNSAEGRKVYLAYVAEGLGNSHDWKEYTKYQRKNGSLFNSPSTTAALLMHHYDDKAHEYLHSLLSKFGNSVPTAYPVDMHTHLRTIDIVEKLGIDRHFRHEIQSMLDNIYRCWLLDDDEICLDTATCAMAFRILRTNGYDVSSDRLSQLNDVNNFNNTLQGYLKDVNTVLELYKASQIKILPSEHPLDSLGSWSRNFLKQALANGEKLVDSVSLQEVDYALKFPLYSNLERLGHRVNIENFNAGNSGVLKTSYKYSINSNDLIGLAQQDFCTSQSIYQEELQNLENWVKDNKLDKLAFARQKQTYCYFSTAATLFSPDMSDARICWAKNSILTTVVDDLFDIGGSREELENLISLVEKWDVNWEKESCSEQVRIIFSTLFNTINELGDKASALQKRSTTEHLVDIWLILLRSMMKEAEWQLNNEVPSVDEYMANGYVSFALGPIILPALYFVGPEIPEDVISHPEYHNLYKLVSTCGRLLNDIQGFQREGIEGKLNSASLRILHGYGSTSEEDVKKEMQKVIDSSRTELLRMVFQQEGSVVPRPCKDLFWKTCKILHLFYMNNDGFTSPKEMLSAVDAVIHEPLKVNQISLSK